MKEALMLGGSIDSSAGDSSGISLTDRYMESTSLGENETKIIQLRAYLPEDYKTKIIKTTFRFETINNDNLSAVSVIAF